MKKTIPTKHKSFSYIKNTKNFLIAMARSAGCRRCAMASFILLFLLIWHSHGFCQEKLKKASYLPHWLPQSQFAGYYIAQKQGIFIKHGIDLTILRGGPDTPTCEALKNGAVDFTSMFLFQAIQYRAQGIPLVLISQISQRAALMLVAKKESGIEKPEDMDGKKLGVWKGEFAILPLAFLKKYGIHMQTIPAASPVNLFLRNGVDVTTAMWYNEYHTILSAGIDADELVTYLFYKHDLNFPEDGIYCLESTFQRDPELCRAFTEAVIEGWRAAFANPDLAIQTVQEEMYQAHVPFNPAHQKWMFNCMRELLTPLQDTAKMGRLDKADYNRVAQVLMDSHVIQEKPLFEAFYKDFEHAEK